MAVCALQVGGQFAQEAVVVHVGEVKIGIPMGRSIAVLQTAGEDHPKSFFISQFAKAAKGVHAQSVATVSVQNENERCTGFHSCRCVVDELAVDADAIVGEVEAFGIDTSAVVHRGSLRVVQGFGIRASGDQEVARCIAYREVEKPKEPIVQAERGIKPIEGHIGSDLAPIPSVSPAVGSHEGVAAILKAEGLLLRGEVAGTGKRAHQGGVAGKVVQFPAHFLAPIACGGGDDDLGVFALGRSEKGPGKGDKEKCKA